MGAGSGGGYGSALEACGVRKLDPYAARVLFVQNRCPQASSTWERS
jgi:hypothetical protein